MIITKYAMLIEGVNIFYIIFQGRKLIIFLIQKKLH